MTAERTCTGPCGRTLPVDVEHFYAQDGGDGFSRRCRECVKAAQRERKAAIAERRKTAPPSKRCAGPCGRTLAADAEHFARDPLDRPRPRCRDCELAADIARAFKRKAAERKAAEREARRPAREAAERVKAAAREAVEREAAERVKAAAREAVERGAPAAERTCPGCARTLPLDADNFHRRASSGTGFTSRCKRCVGAEHRKRRAAAAAPPPTPDLESRELADAERAAEDAELAGLIAELADLSGGDTIPIRALSTRAGRLRFVRRRVEAAPPGQAAKAGERARRVLAAADRDFAELHGPPFDVADVFLDMAENAHEDGVKVLATALRRLGWAP